MSRYDTILLVVLVSPVFFYSLSVSSETVPVKNNLLVDCGSSTNTSAGKRLFRADLKTGDRSVFVTATNSTDSATSQLYKTARVFNETSRYVFEVPRQGRYWIRLFLFPFAGRTYNLSEARFSVAAQNSTLLAEFRAGKGQAVMEEFSLDVSSDSLELTFAPLAGSFAFINAIEIVPVPGGLVPRRIPGALETVYRVNMGNESVPAENDTLSRSWASDGPFLVTPKTRFVNRTDAVRFGNGLTEDSAPRTVYGTATELDIGRDVLYANLSWRFAVGPKSEYLLRFHFCNLGGEYSKKPLLSIYVNSELVSSYGDLPGQGSVGVPYFLDASARVSRGGDALVVSVGPRSVDDSHSTAFLNGLEIMRLVGSERSFDGDDNVVLGSKSNTKIVLMACLAAGLFVVVGAVSALAVALLLRCRKRSRMMAIVDAAGEPGVGVGVFSGAEIAYRFPLSAIREATDNFSENLVIGVGGFGKVYKGVLGEGGTAVAIKRGASESTQGLAEFRTEIEMLSQFRHRHLVSLIGYCDERGEMIIIYEYVENGTLRDRLYGSCFVSLSFKQRLRICIGSARGLHYLHTGSAKPIIHRDVKTANILLDENLMAKVADFGLSKAGPEIDKTHVSTAVKGSFGYLDPEYLVLQRLTEKSDVYSFGVVMLEVLCGRAVVDPSLLPRERVNLVDWAANCSQTGRLEEIVDPCLAGQVSPDSLAKFWEIVEKCLASRGVSRPSMGDVLWNLEFVLQLQGPERAPDREASFQAGHVNSVTAETPEISSVNLGDLAGVSMSKVFAQMVKEDMR